MAELLEAELRGALCMLDLVKIEQSSLYVGTIEQFIRDKDELNKTFKRLTSAQNA
jgi:sensor histidine kinase regulating citrate/malate metabolism